MESVQNKVAVVTGAASGIGLGMVRALTGAGVHVAMLDVEQEALQGAHAQFETANVDVQRFGCDVSDRGQVKDVATAVREPLRAGRHRLQQRGRRCGRIHRGDHGGRLGLGAGRQPARRGQRHAGLRADHEGRRRRRPLREHGVHPRPLGRCADGDLLRIEVRPWSPFRSRHGRISRPTTSASRPCVPA